MERAEVGVQLCAGNCCRDSNLRDRKTEFPGGSGNSPEPKGDVVLVGDDNAKLDPDAVLAVAEGEDALSLLQLTTQE